MNKKTSPFVTQIDLAVADKLKADLEAQGFEIQKPLYTVFAAKKKGVSCTLYESGKLMVQGKEMQDFIEFYLEPEILKSFTYTHAHVNLDLTPRIGIDESGKGDLFGPLCIAGVYADRDGIKKLIELGVRDSKKLNDGNITKLAKEIKKHLPYHCVKINPLKYNELYSNFRNLNHLLGWGHATAIEELFNQTACKSVIIDQFADEHIVINALKRKGVELDLTQRHKGEEDPVVAAASILARDLFVQGLARLGIEYGMTLPKGASLKTIEVGHAFIKKHGKDALPHVCKMHFKTVDILLNKNI